MKLRWWVVGSIAVVAGGVFMIKHLVDSKKTDLNYVENTNEKSIGTFPHEIHDTDFDGIDFLA
jgi:hypothetical protein